MTPYANISGKGDIKHIFACQFVYLCLVFQPVNFNSSTQEIHTVLW